MKTSGFGIRGLFRIAILIVVVLAFLALAAMSYTNITADERVRGEALIRSEVNYLCLQLESLGARTDAFDQVTSSLGASAEEARDANPEATSSEAAEAK